ncbi:hypothetical protein LguiB_026260 [Lonicera macranthoides]
MLIHQFVPIIWSKGFEHAPFLHITVENQQFCWLIYTHSYLIYIMMDNIFRRPRQGKLKSNNFGSRCVQSVTMVCLLAGLEPQQGS